MIVIKVGGSIIKNLTGFLTELKEIWLERRKIVLVHGGGRGVEEYARRMGIDQRYITSVSGFRSRYTDEKTLELVTMVFAGKINKELVANLIKLDVNAIGLSGVDAKLITAKRKMKLKIIDERGRKRVIEGDFSGRPVKINTRLLNTLLEMDFLPVIAPIGVSDEGEILNLDGDRVAALIAGELKFDKLILLTDVEGVYLNGELIERIKFDQLDELIEAVEGGMKKKLLASKEAIERGVNEVIISKIKNRDTIRSALNHLNCTVVS